MVREPGPLLLALSLLTITVLSTPVAAVDHRSCDDVTDGNAVAVDRLYVDRVGKTVEVWWEVNDVPGLQKEGCETADGGTAGPDSHWETVDPLGTVEALQDLLDGFCFRAPWGGHYCVWPL